MLQMEEDEDDADDDDVDDDEAEDLGVVQKGASFKSWLRVLCCPVAPSGGL